jgi:spore coat protein H
MVDPMRRWSRIVLFATAASLVAGCMPDQSVGGPRPGVRDPQAFLFDESQVRTYELVLPDSEWDRINEDPREKLYAPATLHFEGEVVEQVGIRYKGNVGSLITCFDFFGNQTCPKLSMKLKFSEYDRDQRFHGVKRLNFHSMIRDPSHMRDALSYKLFRDNGVPAPRTAFANLIVNGEHLGLFVVVEQIDGRFSRVRFPDGGQGNIYKEVWPTHDDPQIYRDALKSNRRDDEGNLVQDEVDVSRMVRFAEALAEATDETFESVIDAWTDSDALMRYNAVARAIDHWDDIVGWYCIPGQPCFNHNYFWYESTVEDRLWLVAWDTDHTFMEPSPIRTQYGMPDWHETVEDCSPITIFFGIGGMPPSCDDFIRRMATVTWDRYVDATRDLLDQDFRVDALNARIDALEALLESHVSADASGPGLEAWREAVSELREAIVAKVAHIEAKIAD